MKLMFAALFLLFSLSIFAEDNSVKVCSNTTKVCAAFHSDVEFTSKQEGRFHLTLKSEDQTEVDLVKVDLWMQMGGHGHGSSPLKVTPVAPGEFDITKAFFVMRGAWQIRVAYKIGPVQETLILPVMIKQ